MLARTVNSRLNFLTSTLRRPFSHTSPAKMPLITPTTGKPRIILGCMTFGYGMITLHIKFHN